MILVAGATGTLGFEICEQLKQKNVEVAALVRRAADPRRLEGLRSLGVDLRFGDLTDTTSLAKACDGVTACISTANSVRSQNPHDTLESVDRAGQSALIEAALRADVSRFVFISVSGNVPHDSLLGSAKREVEATLVTSGMTYTILRPRSFMEVWLSPFLGFDYEHGAARIVGDGENRLSWISVRDVAAFAVASLDNPNARNRTLEIGGPEALSWLDVVHIFEEISGRSFAVEHIPAEGLHQQLAGAEHEKQRLILELMAASAREDVIDMTETLRTFPMKLTRVRDYAEHACRAVAAHA